MPPTAALAVLAAISFCHLLNDMMQALLPAMYPMLKTAFDLDFGQIGLITLTFQLTASLLQPVIGLYTDHHPQAVLAHARHGLHAGRAAAACRPRAPTLASCSSAGLVGLGSAVFHPESSRVARMASGGRHGLAQSLFQVGGNTGSAVGPLVAAFIVLPRGQRSVAWFSLAALLAIAGAVAGGPLVRAPPRHAAALPRRRRRAATRRSRPPRCGWRWPC